MRHLLVPTLLLLAACAGERIRTDEAEGHTHVFVVPADALRDPPEEGVELTTTEAEGHTHALDLSVISLGLMEDPGGIDVTGETDEADGHAHGWESR